MRDDGGGAKGQLEKGAAVAATEPAERQADAGRSRHKRSRSRSRSRSAKAVPRASIPTAKHRVDETLACGGHRDSSRRSRKSGRDRQRPRRSRSRDRCRDRSRRRGRSPSASSSGSGGAVDSTLLEVVRKRKETQFSAHPGQGLLGMERGLGLGATTVMGMLQGLGGSPVGMVGMMPGLGRLPPGGLGGMHGAAGVLMGATSADPSTKTLREIHFGNMPPLVSQAVTVLAYSTLCSRRHIACPSSALPQWSKPVAAAGLG